MERLTMRDAGGRAFWVSPNHPGGGYRLVEDSNEVFNLGPSRVDRFCKTFSDALTELAEMTVSDTKDMEYTKAKLDDRLKKICGDSFQPWEVRYGK